MEKGVLKTNAVGNDLNLNPHFVSSHGLMGCHFFFCQSNCSEEKDRCGLLDSFKNLRHYRQIKF